MKQEIYPLKFDINLISFDVIAATEYGLDIENGGLNNGYRVVVSSREHFDGVLEGLLSRCYYSAVLSLIEAHCLAMRIATEPPRKATKAPPMRNENVKYPVAVVVAMDVERAQLLSSLRVPYRWRGGYDGKGLVMLLNDGEIESIAPYAHQAGLSPLVQELCEGLRGRAAMQRHGEAEAAFLNEVIKGMPRGLRRVAE